MRFLISVMLLFFVAFLQAQNRDSIRAIAPTGTFLFDPDSTLTFQWATNFDYEGDYRLKILPLDSTAMVPDELPDTSLYFLQEGIAGDQFSYPREAPPLMPDNRYVWQIETAEQVNGRIVKGPVIEIAPLPILSNNCEVSYTGFPTESLCPGDCFTLQATLSVPPFFLVDHQFTLFVDYPEMPAGVITLNDVDAYDQGLLCSSPQQPQVSNTGGSEIALTICVNESVPAPLELDLYYNRPSSFCNDEPCGENCCHHITSFSVEVADLEDFSDVALEIKDPLAINTLNEICSGEQVLFSLLNLPTTANTTINWQYSDDGGQEWQNVEGAPFVQDDGSMPYTFPVFSGNEVLEIDCLNSTTGFVDRLFRAQIIASNTTDTCEYLTAEYSLRICCPLSPSMIEMSTEDDFDLDVGLCEGDELTLMVALQSADLFVSIPGEFVDIQWSVNDVVVSNQMNQTSWDLPVTINTEDLCVEAVVSNCGGKSQTVTRCISVDPQPVCGTITLQDAPMNGVMQNNALVYTVCPDCSGTLLAEGFDPTTCKINWEFAYDVNGPWFPMGMTNTTQNTNIIIEGNNTIIYYRVQCQPLSDPSGCVPCFSNIIGIMEDLQEPVEPFIDCTPLQFCAGTVVEPFVTTIEENTTYTWFVNGVEYSNEEILNYTLEENTCFQYTATNACYSRTSEPCCLQVCKVDALISCPLPPNECACLGDPIILFAGDSQSSCGNELSYEWSWLDAGGNPQTATTVTVSDVPPANGTTYTLTVTDEELGCSDVTTLTIIPCNKQ